MRPFLALALLFCAQAAASQSGVEGDLGVSGYVAAALAEMDETEDDLPVAFLVGSGGYLVGAAGGVGLSYLFVPADSVRGHQIPLRVAAGVAGGTLASAVGVYAANGFESSFPRAVGGAVAGQAIGLGAMVGFFLVDVIIKAVFDSRSEFSVMGVGLLLGTPFYAAAGAEYALTGQIGGDR